jgi:hypothetical protein
MSLYTLDFISNDPYHLDFLGITGLTDIFWDRNTDRLFPRTITDVVCIGITTRFSDELLRVYGSVNALSYRIGGDSISLSYSIGGDMVLTDTIVGSKKLSELIPGDPIKIPVDVATTVDITLSGEQVIDDYATSSSRVLVKNQSDTSENGIYTTASGAWTRTTEYSTWGELYKSYIAVLNGTLNRNHIYICTIPSTGTLGVNAITFSLFSGLPSTISDGILDWSIDKYIPYATRQVFLSFDTSVLDPYLTTRLNLNGSLYTTTLTATAIVDTGVGFRIAGSATTKNILRGNGSSFVSSASAALTKADDTNVTLTLGGTPTTALLDATSLTLGWTGTLASGRLNANVVQAITNDTNVTGSIATQTLTLGWTGELAVGRGGTGINTTTSYSVICAGTTATGAFQSLAALGTAGWVLTSNGAGALPSFQAASGSKWTQSGNNIYRPSYCVGIQIVPSGNYILEVSPNITTTLNSDNITYGYPSIMGRNGSGTATIGNSYIPDWAMIGGAFVSSYVGQNFCNIGSFSFGEGTGCSTAAIGGLFGANDTGAGSAIGIYIQGVTSSTGTTWGIYQGSGTYNYFAGSVGIIGTSAPKADLHINNQLTIGEPASGYCAFAKNAYYSSGWKYIQTDQASLIEFDGDGNIKLCTAVSGTADNAITFSTRLQIYNNTGNISIGTTSTPDSKLSVGSTGSSDFAIYGYSTIGGIKGEGVNETGVAGISTGGVGSSGISAHNYGLYGYCTDGLSPSIYAAGQIYASWGRKPANHIHANNVTDNTIFDAIAPSIPNTNDTVLMHGAIEDSSGYPIILTCSYALRYDSTHIHIYGIGYDYGTGYYDVNSISIVDASSTIHPLVSISW